MKLNSQKKTELSGPGISDYQTVEKILPKNYKALLNPKETQKAVYLVKSFIEEGLCKELNLMKVQVPLFVEKESGINDQLDRDGSRTPVEFTCGLGLKKKLNVQVIQAATKWKRVALKQFGMLDNEGLLTDMRAIRKDYFIDHDHSIYVDQWDWESVITQEQRNLKFLQDTVKKIWCILCEAELYIQDVFPVLKNLKYSNLPKSILFVHAEDLLDMFPEMSRKERETTLLKEYPAIFIMGIGYPLKDGYPHEMRAADYDDWVTETSMNTRGLNGDILVWNHVTQRRHELTSMGIRVNAETLRIQLEMSGQLEFSNTPYHNAILNNEVPLSIGGGIGQARTQMLLLRKAHLGEVIVSTWPKKLKTICARKNIRLLA